MKMGNFGFTELLVILIIVLIIFGPGKLPQIGEALGKAVGKFKHAMKEEETKEEKKDVLSENDINKKTEQNIDHNLKG